MENHKIENKDVLESLLVDLCSGYIIWYVLVEKYCPRILFIFVRNKFIFIVILLRLLWNFYGRLFMWCICCGKGVRFIWCMYTWVNDLMLML